MDSMDRRKRPAYLGSVVPLVPREPKVLAPFEGVNGPSLAVDALLSNLESNRRAVEDACDFDVLHSHSRIWSLAFGGTLTNRELEQVASRAVTLGARQFRASDYVGVKAATSAAVQHLPYALLEQSLFEPLAPGSEWRKGSANAQSQRLCSLLITGPFLWFEGRRHCLPDWHSVAEIGGGDWVDELAQTPSFRDAISAALTSAFAWFRSFRVRDAWTRFAVEDLVRHLYEHFRQALPTTPPAAEAGSINRQRQAYSRGDVIDATLSWFQEIRSAHFLPLARQEIARLPTATIAQPLSEDQAHSRSLALAERRRRLIEKLLAAIPPRRSRLHDVLKALWLEKRGMAETARMHGRADGTFRRYKREARQFLIDHFAQVIGKTAQAEGLTVDDLIDLVTGYKRSPTGATAR